MSNAASPVTNEARAYREASQWLLRLNNDSPTEAETAEWLRWCEQPQNLKAFEELQGDWRDVTALRQDAAFSALEEWEPARRNPQRSFVRSWRMAAAAAFVAALVSATALKPWDRWPALFGVNHIVARGENRETSLPDGSRLVLRAQAAVQVNFAEHERRLELRKDSEAYFKVRHDAARPFIVDAGELSIQAVGTAFDVRHEADRIRVVVEEGSVRVTAPSSASAGVPEQWLVKAGHQLAYVRADGRATLTGVDAEYALRWREGEFAYEGVALGEVAEDINRYASVRILIPDRRVRGLRYTGTVFVRSIDDWLEALTLKYPVRTVTAPNGDILLESTER